MKRCNLHHRSGTVSCREERDHQIFFLSKVRIKRLKCRDFLLDIGELELDVYFCAVCVFYLSRCLINQRNLCWAIQLQGNLKQIIMGANNRHFFLNWSFCGLTV